MKRVLALTLVLVMLFTLAACGGATVNTGLGVITSTAKSKDVTAEADGTAQVDTIVAAVTVDGSGKILAVDIDSAQTKVTFNAEGKLTAELGGDVPTKTDLGDKYGMKAKSGIGKEWYEEIAAFETWLVGKTADQISGMKVTDGKVAEADLTSKVTITITDYQKAVLEAIQNAK